MRINELLANPNDAGLYQIFGEPKIELLKNIVEPNGFGFFGWMASTSRLGRRFTIKSKR